MRMNKWPTISKAQKPEISPPMPILPPGSTGSYPLSTILVWVEMDDDIPALKEKENDKNVNNNDGKRLPRAGRVRSVFPDSWIWTETNIRYLTDTVKNMSIPLHFGFLPCLFIPQSTRGRRRCRQRVSAIAESV